MAWAGLRAAEGGGGGASTTAGGAEGGGTSAPAAATPAVAAVTATPTATPGAGGGVSSEGGCYNCATVAARQRTLNSRCALPSRAPQACVAMSAALRHKAHVIQLLLRCVARPPGIGGNATHRQDYA